MNGFETTGFAILPTRTVAEHFCRVRYSSRGREYDPNNKTTHLRWMLPDPIHRLFPQYPKKAAHWHCHGSCVAGHRGEAEPDTLTDAFNGGTFCWRNRASRRYDRGGYLRSLGETSGDPMEDRRCACNPRHIVSTRSVYSSFRHLGSYLSDGQLFRKRPGACSPGLCSAACCQNVSQDGSRGRRGGNHLYDFKGSLQGSSNRQAMGGRSPDSLRDPGQGNRVEPRHGA